MSPVSGWLLIRRVVLVFALSMAFALFVLAPLLVTAADGGDCRRYGGKLIVQAIPPQEACVVPVGTQPLEDGGHHP